MERKFVSCNAEIFMLTYHKFLMEVCKMEERNLVEVSISTEVLVRVFLKLLWQENYINNSTYLEIMKKISEVL